MPIRTIAKAVCAAGLFCASLGITAQSAHAQSAHFCDNKARAYASRHADGAGFVGGAVGGAITGAIIGGVINGGKGAGRGAAIGGGVGAVGGAIHESQAWQAAYNRAYRRCMQRAPIRASHDRPQRWSEAWYDYCASKYRSFNPETGRYRTYSGKYKMCR